jgi:chromatin segregation and condensation protein Rec8/ScpA/Scc1 (kleisin family)
MAEIQAVIRDTWSLLFSSLLGAQRLPTDVVVTLLAILELARLGAVRVQQTDLFGEIVVERRATDPAASSAGPAGPIETGNEVNLAHTD